MAVKTQSQITPKLRIMAAGLTCRQVAAGAGIAASTLSNYMAGRRRGREAQGRIAAAFAALAGRAIGPRRFWGDLYTRASRRRRCKP